MPRQKLKVARIGNSRGVRLPAETLERYRIGDSVIMEECAGGILLRPSGSATPKLSWDETAKAMARSGEDWTAWNAASADGVDGLTWPSKARGEAMRRYEVRLSRRRPAVIVSMDALNARLETVTVCPLTTQLHPAWRTRLAVTVSRKRAEVAVEQMRTMGKSKLGTRLGSLSKSDAAALRRLITEMYGTE